MNILIEREQIKTLIVTSIENSGGVKPAIDGVYIFIATPSDNLPAGISLNDIAKLSGGVWFKLFSYANAPGSIIVNQTFYTKNGFNSWERGNGVSLIHTGLISGGDISINTDTTKFNISAGKAYFADRSDPENLIITKISWAEKLANSTPFLATNANTWIGIDASGTVITSSTDFSAEQLRTIVRLGNVSHSNNTNIDGTFYLPLFYYESFDWAYEIIKFGVVRTEGNNITANGANLLLNRSAGECWRIGANARESIGGNLNNPNLTLTPQATGFTFLRAYRSATGTTTIEGAFTAINTTQWDNGSGTLQTVSKNKATILTVYFFPIGANSTTLILYGQDQYASITEAIANAPSYTPIINSDAAGGIILGRIAILKGVTNLTAAIVAGDAKIFGGNVFGVLSSGSAGATSASIWGAITGTLSNQVDLQSALDAKAGDGANTDITSITGLTTALAINQGGTNSNTALNNDRVMISSAGAIIESDTITTAELNNLNGIVSVSTGTADNDKFVTQGYVDDAGGRLTLQTLTATGNITDWNYAVKADATSGQIIATIPTAVGNSGKRITVTKIDNSTNTVRIITTSSQTISGKVQDIYLYNQGDSVEFISDGANVVLTSDNRGSATAIITESINYTPTIAGYGSGGGTATGNYRRNGSYAKIYISVTKDGTAGSGTTTMTFTIPNGLTIDTSKLNIESGVYSILGVATSNSAFKDAWTVRYNSSTAIFLTNDVDGVFEGQDFLANSNITIIFEVPILGWSAMGQNVVSTVDYLYATKNAQQIVSGGSADITWQNYTGNIEHTNDTTFLLKAGKIYELEGACIAVSNSAGGYYRLGWYDITNSQNIGTEAIISQMDRSVQEGVIATAKAYIQPIADTLVKLTMRNASLNITGLGLGTTGAYVKIQQTGSTAVIADLTSDQNGNLSSESSFSSVNTFGFKNRIINGDMRIDQRNAGASVTPSFGQTYILDRWQMNLAQASKVSIQQSSVSPNNQAYSTLFTSLSAYSVGVSDSFEFRQHIEGLNVSDLGWGTVTAKPVTVSFKVRSSLTGTFGGVIQNSAQNRSYPFTFTINEANTFEAKTVIVQGDTTGTWLKNNGTGLILSFSLGAGTNLSGTSSTWASADYRSATGAVSLVETNGATLYITEVQLEKGTQATSFDFRSIGQERSLCERYYFRTHDAQSFSTIMSGGVEGATSAAVGLVFPTEMRIVPTSTLGSGIRFYSFSTLAIVPTIQSQRNTKTHGGLNLTISGATGGQAGYLYNAPFPNSYVEFSAEL